jgi:hypothetical protein
MTPLLSKYCRLQAPMDWCSCYYPAAAAAVSCRATPAAAASYHPSGQGEDVPTAAEGVPQAGRAQQVRIYEAAAAATRSESRGACMASPSTAAMQLAALLLGA